jgi:hypothetical protein
MKSKMKLIVGLTFLLCLGTQPIKAQLFQTRADIIKEEGYGYSTGVTDDGTKYIYYDKEQNTNASGNYTQRKIMYFMNLDNGSEICYLWKILEPSSETNSNVAFFKSKYVEVAYMQWKDYELNIIYDIVVEDGICIITAWWDNKK